MQHGPAIEEKNKHKFSKRNEAINATFIIEVNENIVSKCHQMQRNGINFSVQNNATRPCNRRKKVSTSFPKETKQLMHIQAFNGNFLQNYHSAIFNIS